MANTKPSGPSRYCFVARGCGNGIWDNPEVVLYSEPTVECAVAFCRSRRDLECIDFETGIVCYEPGDKTFQYDDDMVFKSVDL